MGGGVGTDGLDNFVGGLCVGLFNLWLAFRAVASCRGGRSGVRFLLFWLMSCFSASSLTRSDNSDTTLVSVSNCSVSVLIVAAVPWVECDCASESISILTTNGVDDLIAWMTASAIEFSIA